MTTTLFTTPRPLLGQYKVIQTNALKSWSLLNPKPTKTVVFADRDKEGDLAVDLAGDLAFSVEPILRRSPRNVPLLSDLFPRAQQMGDVACYTNADIILTNDLLPALDAVAAKFDTFLAVSGRLNVQVLDYIDFSTDWLSALHQKIREQGSRMPECAIDLFAWRGDVFGTIPDYAIGRYRWDNYLMGAPLTRGVPVIDISPVVTLIHQTHAQCPWEDPDATANFAIEAPACGLKDSSHTLTKDGIVEGWCGNAPLTQ